jgi:hypothetical protein
MLNSDNLYLLPVHRAPRQLCSSHVLSYLVLAITMLGKALTAIMKVHRLRDLNNSSGG